MKYTKPEIRTVEADHVVEQLGPVSAGSGSIEDQLLATPFRRQHRSTSFTRSGR